MPILKFKKSNKESKDKKNLRFQFKALEKRIRKRPVNKTDLA